MNDSIGQLDQQLGYTLQLADYYSTIAPNNVTVDGISVPGWTMLKLKDLLTYRVTSFLSSKTISFDEGSPDYYDSLNQAINLGLVTLKDVGLVPLSDEIVNGRNKQSVQVVNGLDQEQDYNYISSNYSITEKGITGQLVNIKIPTLAQLYPNLFGKYYYDQELENYAGSAQISVSTNPTAIPDRLINYQNYIMGLIYFSNSELVSYNQTIPNNSWQYNENGTLVYVTNSTTVTETYYKPWNGTWVNDYLFVPSENVTRGLWVWNTSVMPEPDAYQIDLAIPSVTSDQQTFSSERMQGDTINYVGTIPIRQRGADMLNVSISELTTIAKKEIGT